MCTPTGVYKKEGGPRSSHYFAFQKILSTIYVYGDGNTTCILIRISRKKVYPSASLLKDSKIILSNQGLTTFMFQQVNIFYLFSVLFRKGYYGMHTSKKSKRCFHPLNYLCRTAYSWKIFSTVLQTFICYLRKGGYKKSLFQTR